MRLTTEEQDRYERDGFVVRDRLLGRDDVDALIQASEELERDLLARRKGDERRMALGAYVFERDALDGVVLKWEPDAPDRLMGIEPVAHLHPIIEKYAFDERLLDPARDLVGSDDLVLSPRSST